MRTGGQVGKLQRLFISYWLAHLTRASFAALYATHTKNALAVVRQIRRETHTLQQIMKKKRNGTSHTTRDKQIPRLIYFTLNGLIHPRMLIVPYEWNDPGGLALGKCSLLVIFSPISLAGRLRMTVYLDHQSDEGKKVIGVLIKHIHVR